MEVLQDFKDAMSKRIKGAFGGTFILIWLLLNWKLLYIVANFDSTCMLDDKLLIINNYIVNNYPLRLLFYPAGLALISVISYNLLNYSTYAVITFFSLRVKPFILKKIDSRKIVEKIRLDTVEKIYFDLDDKYNKEKAAFVKSINDIDLFKKALEKKEVELNEKNSEKERLIADVLKVEEEIKSSYDAKLVSLASKLNEAQSELYQTKIDTVLKEIIIEPEVFFKGVWKKTFAMRGKRSGSENFEIQGQKYIINQKEYFEIEYIKIYDGKFIELKKISTINNGILINKLVKIDDDHFIGTENDTVKVEYEKISNFKEGDL